MNWRDVLQARLLDLQPASVLALDEPARDLARSMLPGALVQLQDSRPEAPSALALGIDALDELDARQAMELVSQIRLYAAPRILLAVSAACALDVAAFRALGFMTPEVPAEGDRRIHYYDLYTYKTVPDWLNARFWAHPERWEP